MQAQQIQLATRDIVYRTEGYTGGPITRLMSPSDLGEILKPFVFLDRAIFEAGMAPMAIEDGWHPHSGIATVTVMLEGAVRIAETTGFEGVVPTGGVEWMRAAGGVWHTGAPEPGRMAAFQLWVALPPELENGPNQSNYVLPADFESVGPARVILGQYQGARSPIEAPPMTYLHVRLADRQAWTFEPAPGETVAWLAVHRGSVHTPEAIATGELVVFDRTDNPIELVAEGDTELVLGSAAPHPHDLVLGRYSVHTSVEALQRGQTEIRRIGRTLRERGTLRRSIQL